VLTRKIKRKISTALVVCPKAMHTAVLACNPSCVPESEACVDLIVSGSNSGNQSKQRKQDGDVRRNPSRSASPIPSRRLDNAANGAPPAPAAKRSRTSCRNIKFCADLTGIDHSFKCNGCARWDALVFKKKL